ncbi:MAG: GNAT family N-acetyltransferase [Cyclobacteriaceae bacterium]|nr:GNAT family N-acetyltransferase [Cyclobacteriaceae bacterium]
MSQELETTRLLLKEITEDHLPLFFELHSYPEVDRFNTMGIPSDLQTTRQILLPAMEDQLQEMRSKYCWAVFRKEDHAFIGELGFSVSSSKYRRGEVHYLLIPDHWGKGYATELVKRIIAFGFDHLHLHRVEAGVATENVASLRVLEKAGMTREGCHRQILPIRGHWVDNYHYAILESDPR